MRVITSLFSAGREGTDKGEGVPPGRWAAFGRCGIMWATANEPNILHSARKRRNGKKMKLKRMQEQFTVINGGSLPDNFRGRAKIEYKKVAYNIGYEVEFDRSTLPDYFGEV